MWNDSPDCAIRVLTPRDPSLGACWALAVVAAIGLTLGGCESSPTPYPQGSGTSAPPLVDEGQGTSTDGEGLDSGAEGTAEPRAGGGFEADVLPEDPQAADAVGRDEGDAGGPDDAGPSDAGHDDVGPTDGVGECGEGDIASDATDPEEDGGASGSSGAQ